MGDAIHPVRQTSSSRRRTTRCRPHQDEWWRPVTDIPVTEPRKSAWWRFVRRTSPRARSCIHLDRASHSQSLDNVGAVNTGVVVNRSAAQRNPNTPSVGRRVAESASAVDGVGDRRATTATLEGTGKLIMPGEKISWDQHIHVAGEAVTGGSELGLWLYPKGQEPKKRSYLVGFTGLKNGTEALDIPPNRSPIRKALLKENTIITNFQPHLHLRGKGRCRSRRFCRTAERRRSAT